MIKSIKVNGLNGKNYPEVFFNEDLNIFTGKNGSGKTTFLKLMWFLISGNIERALEEIEFEYVHLRADNFEIEIRNQGVKEKSQISHIKYIINNEVKEAKVLKVNGSVSPTIGRKDDEYENINTINTQIAMVSKESLFFPTFRRIEGGFSGTEKHSRFDLEESLNRMSNRISVNAHKFITSVSTVDITNLLNERFAKISEQTNKLHTKLTKHIENEINQYTQKKNRQSDKNQLDSANEILDSIHKELNNVTYRSEQILKPISVLSELTQIIFQYNGIKVSSALTLGDTKEAMLSDKLSAGEKQMLSFLCYNAFFQNCPIFIDEPEISLNVDWQRILFPTLLEQSKENQFFIATHSPFIYSKYNDKEIVLNNDKGDSNVL